MIQLPRFGVGIWPVWLRNFLYFRYSIWASILWIFIEPIMYLLAIGYGVGSLVQEVDGIPYREFFLPGLIATSGMMVAFFESAYGSYTKLSRQRTYSTILMAPINEDEIVIGEIFWYASKAFFSVLGVTIVAIALGMVKTWLILPALIVLFLQCWIFAAFGMYFAAIASNYDSFVYAQSGIIIPMSLFSGTYFPLEKMPLIFQYISYLFPLTHTTVLVRAMLRDDLLQSNLFNLVALILMTALLTNLAVSKMRKKIVY